VRNSFRLPSSAFSVPPVTATKDVSASSESTAESSNERIEDSSNAELKFVAQINTESSALPYTSKDDVISFFKSSQNRNMFITAGGKRECQRQSLTPEILRDWTEICRKEGMAPPDETDEVFVVKTGGVQFPGLTLEASAIMGVKLTEDGTDPKYVVTMIGDERKAKGLPPVVYIFNKLTGGGSKNGSSANLSFTDIVCEFIDGDEPKVVFKTDTRFVITVKFPAFLMKILPTNKEKAEEQGSQAIKKAVSKDVEASMLAYEEAYLNSCP